MIQQKSTFQGDRGGDAYDAELLALLRGVSDRSGATDRFGNDDEPPVQTQQALSQRDPNEISSKPGAKEETKEKDENLPPWKKGKRFSKPAASATIEVLVASPSSKKSVPKEERAFSGFQNTSNFQGERGGDAHDEELLALLKGVSAKSSSADRFDTEIDETTDDVTVKAVPFVSSSTAKKPKDVPPWKQKPRSRHENIAPEDSDIIVAVKAKPEPFQDQISGSGNFQQKSSFQGDRGGDAHDEELLALLRGVSEKSGATARFEGPDAQDEPPPSTQPQSPGSQEPPPPSAPSSDTPTSTGKKKKWKMLTPPWKKKDKKKLSKAESPSMDIIVSKPKSGAVAPDLPDIKAPVLAGKGNFQSGPSTFQGERGGDAHDEELLALLRGVSSSKDRFAEEPDAAIETHQKTQSAKTNPSPTISAEEEAPIPAGKGNFQSGPSTFQGERGGDAHDEELLALLRGVSSSKDRFAEEPDAAIETHQKTQSAKTNPSPTISAEEEAPIPAGKGNFQSGPSTFQGERGGDAHDEELLALLRGVSSSKDRFAEEPDAAIEIHQKTPSAKTNPSPTTSAEEELPIPAGKGNFQSLPSTFQGERGGDAHDEELLALLRGVSSSNGRFAEESAAKAVKPKTQNPEIIPDASPEIEAPIPAGKGNFQSGPSTFQGERGGDAHDEELLALLRGVSSSNGRFAEESAAKAVKSKTQNPAIIPDASPEIEAPIPAGKGNFQSGPSTFQGERGGDAHDEELLALLRGVSSSRADEVVEKPEVRTSSKEETKSPLTNKTENQLPLEELPVMAGRGDFKQESTYQGERGGDAHDEDLLALLRGVSSGVGNTSRPPSFATSIPTMPSPFPTAGDGQEEIVVTLSDLPSAFSDKNWNVRKEAYSVLQSAIKKESEKGSPGTIDADSIFPGLDGCIPSLMAEKNAIALEFALQAGTDYANFCQGASSEEQASKIVKALLKGNGLSSPRPTSAKVATAFVLKLMEVGSTADSMKIVASLLVEKAWTSKKPKVVLLSTSIILEAMHSFGVAHLPLAEISSTLPKVLAHTNKKIRDTGVEIAAELCRSFQSKDPLSAVVEKMQKAQVKDLDNRIQKQPDPVPPKIGLRCKGASAAGKGGVSCAADVFSALQAGSEELEKERFARRPTVQLIEKISKTNYSSELKEAKWSKKVGALDTILKCAGEKPYKLAQPSSSNNYVPLIIDMKGLLTHTHFLVVSKALDVLGMLAEGVGGKLYSNLRPLLPKLLQLSKDKKLTNAVSTCLDACFGNVFGFNHLTDSKASIPDATNDSVEKNALARMSALDYLDRCIARGASAGPFGTLTPKSAKACAKLASKRLDDSDAKVRKSAMKILTSLQTVDDDEVGSEVNDVINELQHSNSRAYKSLSRENGASKGGKSSIPKARSVDAKKSSGLSQMSPRSKKSSVTVSSQPSALKQSVPPSTEFPKKNTASVIAALSDEEVPSYEDALVHCASLGIPLWEEPDENEGGLLVGIQSTKWQPRQKSISEMAGFINSCPPAKDHIQIQKDCNALLVVVKNHTKGFKESNMYVMRSIVELFAAICNLHERSNYPLATWAVNDAISLTVPKIADRKLSSHNKALLLSLCVVHPPGATIVSACSNIEKVRAPLAHEEFLMWMKEFCTEFGAASFSSNLKEIVTCLSSECISKNVKVKRAAFATVGLIYTHLGPTFKAGILADMKDPAVREELEKNFGQYEFDPSIRSQTWPRAYIGSLGTDEDSTESQDAAPEMTMEIPKTDLISQIPPDCIGRMGSKDGKTSWKVRKGALEEVEKALKSSVGVLDTTRMAPLKDLLRALTERLSDSQSNLKPLAVRLIGDVLGSVEGQAQGKLGKIAYGPIIGAAISDKRKVMNDASMDALKQSVSIPRLKGDGFNDLSMEPFVVALIGELEGSEFKSVGISGVLTFMASIVSNVSNLDKISSQRGQTVGSRLAWVLVNGLSSSKSDIRSASEKVLSECISNNVLSMQTARKSLGRMAPAMQQSVGILLAKISKAAPAQDKSKSMMSSRSERKSSVAPSQVSSKSTPNAKTQKSLSSRSTRATAQKHRIPSASTKKFSAVDDDKTEAISNPLDNGANPLGFRKSRAAMQSLTWPEYPEGPSGATLYSGLKKAWSPIVPPNSIDKLFPAKGIRNQSDVVDAFKLLKHAISMDRDGGGSLIANQLHFILRWSVFVMGCKESAVGLTGLLGMLLDLVSFLNYKMHEFSDTEMALFVPFIVEKASSAKGRFLEMVMDLIESITRGTLVPQKKFGPFVCVPLMENSTHPKARLIACQHCYRCVEAIGLSGIGKKGVIVAAKALSNEKLPENKAAFLDLLVLLLSRMNNDVQRLSKICGLSLSHQAKELIEDRVQKASSPTKASPKSKMPTAQKSSRLQRPSPSKLPSLSSSRDALDRDYDFSAPSIFEDKLPALDIRRALREKGSPISSPTKPSKLSYGVEVSSLPSANLGSTSFDSRQGEHFSADTVASSSIPNSSSSPIGAAASLRARLLKIRESNKLNSEAKPSETISIPMQEVRGQTANDAYSGEDSEYQPMLEQMFQNVRALLVKPCPISENDDDLISCTDLLKNIHAAVSKQPNLAVTIPMNHVGSLRDEIRERATEVVGILTQIIGFGFFCHDKSVSAGMSVPLLSVNLAGLMAIFRSTDLATLVNVDDLTILIKEAGTALLDPRLAQSSKRAEGDPFLIDETTSTQMVRAINKLAVQAATGASRENSMQALIRLQDQLSLNATSCDDPQFNARLARVVTKLATRVIKAEENEPEAFTSASMDMESLLCCLEDTMGSGNTLEQADGVSTTNIAKLVVVAILKTRGESTTIMQEMEELGIDSHRSSLGQLVHSCASELGLVQKNARHSISQKDDVASLVSAVVGAQSASDREIAIDALRNYKETYGDEELSNHLNDVSPVFRDYLLKELATASRPPSPNPSEVSMSERIKNLRSKLNATDTLTSNTVKDDALPSNQLDQQQRMENLRAKLNATKSSMLHHTSDQPSPILTSAPEDMGREPTNPSNPTIAAFRERLAAAKERKAASREIVSPVPNTSASNRAAALRARLQAVKMQNKL